MSKRPQAELFRAYLDHVCRQSGPSRVLRWPDWLRLTVGGTLAVGATLGPVACGGESMSGEAVSAAGGGGAPPNVPGAEICTDGIDNDADGSVDCDDSDCDPDASCATTGGTGGAGGAEGTGGLSGFGGTLYGIPLEVCTDGVDNNFNNLIDCDDPYCSGNVACPGTGGAPGAGGDPGVGGAAGNGGTGGVPATGGAAGDGGSTIDPGTGGGMLYGIPWEDCFNGYDDDHDGAADCDDPDCSSNAACQGTGGVSGAGGEPGVGGDPGIGGMGGTLYGVPYELYCDNGYSDDMDGLVDCDDPDCIDDPACAEAGGAGGQGGSSAMTCQQSAGICTTVPLVASPCAQCDPTTALLHIPAPPSDPAMGCITNDNGVTPLCCLPVLDVGDCVNAGGGCYPTASSGETCPAGWDAVYTACAGGDTCCVPGPDCDDSG
jgi:hypothetical protein